MTETIEQNEIINSRLILFTPHVIQPEMPESPRFNLTDRDWQRLIREPHGHEMASINRP